MGQPESGSQINHQSRIPHRHKHHRHHKLPPPAPLPGHQSHIVVPEPHAHPECSFHTLHHRCPHSLHHPSFDLDRRLMHVHGHREHDQYVSC